MSELDLPAAGNNEAQGSSFGFSASQPAKLDEPTGGALLRRAREAAGVHIGALAVALKVPVKRLEALEQDRIDLLPDAVFARALASSVCRHLKLDAKPVLDRLPQTIAPRLARVGGGLNAPFRSPGEAKPSLWAQVSRPAVLAGLVFLLGALVLIFLPASKRETSPDKAEAGSSPDKSDPLQVLVDVQANAAAAPIAVPAEAGPVESPQLNPLPGAASPTISAGPSTPLMLPAVPVAGVPGVSGAVTAALPAAAASAVVAVNPSVSAAAPAGIVTFRATGESWVEVIDSKGVAVLRRTLAAGETASVSGALPLTTIVGRADLTQVQVRGKAFDLKPVVKDNVARFEVK